MDIYIDKVKQEIENQRNQYKLLEQEKLALLHNKNKVFIYYILFMVGN